MSEKPFNPYLYMLNENRVIWIIMGITIFQAIVANLTGWVWLHLVAVLLLAAICLPHKGKLIRDLASPFTKAMPTDEVSKRLSGIVPALIIHSELEDPDVQVTINISLKERGAGGSISTKVHMSNSRGADSEITQMADALLLSGVSNTRAYRNAIIEGWAIEQTRSVRLSNHEHLSGMAFLSRAREAMK